MLEETREEKIEEEKTDLREELEGLVEELKDNLHIKLNEVSKRKEEMEKKIKT